MLRQSKYKGKIETQHVGINLHNALKLENMPSEARLKILKLKKKPKLFMLIITVQIFSLCYQIFPYDRTKFPVFSLSGKSKNQIPCFPCAVATLDYHTYCEIL